MTDASDVVPALIGAKAAGDVAPSIIGLSAKQSLQTHIIMQTRDARPLPGVVAAGTFFYASDQVALYLSDGTQWLRVGPAMPGDIIWTNEAAARPGYVLLDGSAWPSTAGIYAELFALWGGANLPDVRGRTFASLGTHADMSTLLNNEGVAIVANRRQKHRTTNNLTVSAGTLAGTIGSLAATIGSLATTVGSLSVASAVNFLTSGGANLAGIRTEAQGTASEATTTNPLSVSGAPTLTGTPGLSGTPGITGAPALGGSIGTNVSTDPIDSGAYIVLQPQAKL